MGSFSETYIDPSLTTISASLFLYKTVSHPSFGVLIWMIFLRQSEVSFSYLGFIDFSALKE